MEGQYLHKRNKFQIYYDILSGINLETNSGEGAKPTRVQVHSNLAYDKLAKYLKELEMNEMILQNLLRITEKGREFLQDHDCAKNVLHVSGYFGFASIILIMFNLSLC